MPPAVTPRRFFLLRRRKQLPEPENRTGFGRAAEGANGDVENGRDSDVSGIRTFHATVLEAGPTVEGAGRTRASFQALEHDFARRVHSRAVHRNAPTPHRFRFSPDRTPPRAGRLIQNGFVGVKGPSARFD